MTGCGGVGTSTAATYRSIDDCLGPARTRFFADGYRRVRYLVRDVVVRPPASAGPAGVTAVVTVEYPRDWSRKVEGVDLRPHLSTVDTLLLAVQLSEAYLAGALGLDEEQRRWARLRKVTLHAGSKPQEDLVGLVAVTIPVACEPTGRGDQVRTTFDSRIGAMRARCHVEHTVVGRAGQAGGPVRYDGLAGLLAPATERYYGEGFHHRGVELTGVAADLAACTASADVRVRHIRSEAASGAPPWPAGSGVDGAHQPTLTMVEAFVTGLQLAQVLMYPLDNVARQESDTLWMLNTLIEAPPTPAPLDGPTRAHISIPGRRLLPLRGETWRNLDIVGTAGGLSLRSSIAHRLPPDPAAAAHGKGRPASRPVPEPSEVRT